MTRRTQADRRQKSEKQLIDNAILLIAKRGVEGLRLAELGAAAGYSRGLAGHYFGTKEVLISRVIERIFTRYNKLLAKGSEATGLSAINIMVREHVRTLVEAYPEVVALHEIYRSASTNPDVKEMVADLTTKRIDSIKSALQQAYNANVSSPEFDVHSEAIQLQAFIRGLAALFIVDNKIPIKSVSEDYLRSLGLRLGLSDESSKA